MGKLPERFYAGVDPGKSGSIVILDNLGTWVDDIRLDRSYDEINKFLGEHRATTSIFTMVEKVRTLPNDGKKGAFTFGGSFEAVQALLVANDIPYKLVVPTAWQHRMGCLTGGNKKISLARAKNLFPEDDVNWRNCDAFLLAKLCHRLFSCKTTQQISNFFLVE